MAIGEREMPIGESPMGISARRWRWPGANGQRRAADEHFRPAMGIGEPAMGISGAPMSIFERQWESPGRQSVFLDANALRRGANAYCQTSEEHFRAAMPIGETPMGIGEAAMRKGEPPIRKATRLWASATGLAPRIRFLPIVFLQGPPGLKSWQAILWRELDMLLQTTAPNGPDSGFFLEVIKAINDLETWEQIVGLALALLIFLAVTILWRVNPRSSAQLGFAKVMILAILAVFLILILSAMWISASGNRTAEAIRGQLQESGVANELEQPLTLTAGQAGQSAATATDVPPALAAQVDELTEKSIFYSQAGVEGFSNTAPSVARLAFLSGRPEEAKLLLQASLDQSPEEAKALNDLGVIYYTEGRKAEDPAEKDRLLEVAAEHFRQAVQQDPSLVTAINNLGLIELERGNLEAALAKFNEALAIDPEYARALNNRGLAYRRLGRKETDETVKKELLANAKADFQAGIAKQPEIADIYYNLALLEELDLKNPAAAVEHYRKTVELDPRNVTALNNLSFLLQQEESPAARQEAVLLARRAVEIQPNEACLVDTLARAYLVSGDCANALVTANRAIALQSRVTGRLRCNAKEIRSLPQQINAQCPDQ